MVSHHRPTNRYEHSCGIRGFSTIKYYKTSVVDFRLTVLVHKKKKNGNSQHGWTNYLIKTISTFL